MSTPSDSYVLHDHSPSTDTDDVDSIPSISSSILDSDSEYDDESDAQKEWERSLEQLQLLMTMVLIPFAGKFLGRKFAYWSKTDQTGQHRKKDNLGWWKSRLLTKASCWQVGDGTWSGCTGSRSNGITRRYSTLPVGWEPRRRYDEGIARGNKGVKGDGSGIFLIRLGYQGWT